MDEHLLRWLPSFAQRVAVRCDTAYFAALALLTVATSSFLAMNFTGATPFTSPSGVEKEMRRAIPAQIMTMAIGMIVWLKAIWTG